MKKIQQMPYQCDLCNNGVHGDSFCHSREGGNPATINDKIDSHCHNIYTDGVLKAFFYLGLILTIVTNRSFAANPQVTLHISGAISGMIVVELYADQAPITTENFINYVQNSFYNGLIFHRVISNFMIQGGGFDQNLNPRTTNPAILNESSNRLSNLRGTIAMARTTYADTATSQFFINLVDNTSLDFNSLVYNIYTGQYHAQIGYCVFGRVIQGMTVVDAIAAVPTTTENGMTNVPVNDVIIQSATITLNAPVCGEKLDGDSNGDCSVNFADFVNLAENWLSCNSITPICN